MVAAMDALKRSPCTNEALSLPKDEGNDLHDFASVSGDRSSTAAVSDQGNDTNDFCSISDDGSNADAASDDASEGARANRMGPSDDHNQSIGEDTEGQGGDPTFEDCPDTDSELEFEMHRRCRPDLKARIAAYAVPGGDSPVAATPQGLGEQGDAEQRVAFCLIPVVAQPSQLGPPVASQLRAGQLSPPGSPAAGLPCAGGFGRALPAQQEHPFQRSRLSSRAKPFTPGGSQAALAEKVKEWQRMSPGHKNACYNYCYESGHPTHDPDLKANSRYAESLRQRMVLSAVKRGLCGASAWQDERGNYYHIVAGEEDTEWTCLRRSSWDDVNHEMAFPIRVDLASERIIIGGRGGGTGLEVTFADVCSEPGIIHWRQCAQQRDSWAKSMTWRQVW